MYNITPKNFSHVNQYFPLIIALGKERSFRKGEFICRQGDDASHLFYMTSGLVKCFQLKEGKEVILRLMSDNSAVLSYSGFITGSPSLEFIECLQPCKGVWIAIEDVEDLCKQNPKIDAVFRYLAEQHYLSMERRLIMLHHKSSKDRYQYFCETMEGKIIEETPMHCIASYLGMTPESFSRMKSRLIN